MVNITLVCKAWHSIAQQLMESKLELDFKEGRPRQKVEKLLLALKSRKLFRNKVRSLTILDWYMSDTWFLIENVAETMRRLKLAKFMYVENQP